MGFKRFVPALDLPVALRVIGRGAHVAQTGNADELLKIFAPFAPCIH
jgi:hypothetical protein